MTRDDIIRMARLACETTNWKPGLGNEHVVEFLERFATLVAAKYPKPTPAERKPLSREDIVNIYETPEIAGSYFETGTEKAIALTRAVERAHHIKAVENVACKTLPHTITKNNFVVPMWHCTIGVLKPLPQPQYYTRIASDPKSDALHELLWIRQFIHKNKTKPGVVIRNADGEEIAAWIDRVDAVIEAHNIK